MVFNKVTDSLRQWCIKYAYTARSAYSPSNSNDFRAPPSSLTCRTASDLAFWLGTLTDRDFAAYPSYCRAVRELLPVRITPPLRHDPSKIEQYYIQKTERAFLKEFSRLTPDCPSPGIPYFRVLPEAEASSVKRRLAEVWDCHENQYWYPLSAVRIPKEQLCYLSASSLEGRLEHLAELLDVAEQHSYCLYEGWFDLPNCVETGEMDDYAGSECFYSAKDFRWLIYFSHEETVSFAGSIVPAVKARFGSISR